MKIVTITVATGGYIVSCAQDDAEFEQEIATSLGKAMRIVKSKLGDDTDAKSDETSSAE